MCVCAHACDRRCSTSVRVLICVYGACVSVCMCCMHNYFVCVCGSRECVMCI